MTVSFFPCLATGVCRVACVGCGGGGGQAVPGRTGHQGGQGQGQGQEASSGLGALSLRVI